MPIADHKWEVLAAYHNGILWVAMKISVVVLLTEHKLMH